MVSNVGDRVEVMGRWSGFQHSYYASWMLVLKVLMDFSYYKHKIGVAREL